LPDKQVAARLSLSVCTIPAPLSRACAKLSAAARAPLAVTVHVARSKCTGLSDSLPRGRAYGGAHARGSRPGPTAPFPA